MEGLTRYINMDGWIVPVFSVVAAIAKFLLFGDGRKLTKLEM